MNRKPESYVRVGGDYKNDMTSMVDVTFLLLIFFMVTASFTVQAAMDLPSSSRDSSKSPPKEMNQRQDRLTVFVSPDNEYRVKAYNDEWRDAVNRHELRRQLKVNLTIDEEPLKLLILAHMDCFHDKFVQAMDIGIELGLQIQIEMTSELF